MLTGSDIYQQAAGSVANVIITKDGARVSSGTGFVISGMLVTCAHVVKVPLGFKVKVEFEKPAPDQVAGWEYDTLAGAFAGFSDEHSYDYAILKPPRGVTLASALKWADEQPSPGEPVCCLGYPFDDPHITLHQGHISAVFRSGLATMLKLDMSVNPSNSGGPLIRMSDGAVVGVVARKATGLTRAFQGLIESYDANVAALEASRATGGVSIMGIDPLGALAIGQRQMKQVSLEIQRSANVGIGYAIWTEPLRHEAALSPSSSE